MLDKPLGEIPIGLLEWAFVVGAAFQCADNQSVIDFIIPTYSGPLKGEYNAKYLGAIGGQTKAKAESTSQELGADITLPPIVFERGTAEPERVKKQTIVIRMDLCTLPATGLQTDPVLS